MEWWRRLLGRSEYEPALGWPSNRGADRPGGKKQRRPNRVCLPLFAGRSHAVRPKRTHPPRTRRDERVHRALSDRGVLVRIARRVAGGNGPAADREWAQRERTSLLFSASE